MKVYIPDKNLVLDTDNTTVVLGLSEEEKQQIGGMTADTELYASAPDDTPEKSLHRSLQRAKTLFKLAGILPEQKPKLFLLPEIVVSFCWNHSAWIVGSAALYMAGLENQLKRPRDIDVCVPFHEWGQASILIPRGTPANTAGGFKIKTEWADGKESDVDVWPGDLLTLFSRTNMEAVVAFHPMSNRLVRLEHVP